MNDKKTNVYVKMSTRVKLKELAGVKGMSMLGLIDMLVNSEIERMKMVDIMNEIKRTGGDI